MTRVLIVDDSAATRAFVRRVISQPGTRWTPCEVDEAESGFEALRLLSQTHYDVIVSDINMPDIHGLDVVQYARKSRQHARTPVLVISTQGAERDVQRALALGANDFLHKPFSKDELLAALERVLS
jgi:two-component system chemotaxis response regulator CheY